MRVFNYACSLGTHSSLWGCLCVCVCVVLFKMFILSFESCKIYSFVSPFLHCLFSQTGLVSSSLMKVKGNESRSVVSDSLRPHGLYSPWNSPGQNTGEGSLSLLQGIFPPHGWNPGLPHCRRILSQLSHQGSPRILERAAYPFSRGSSRPRNRTGVSCIAGRSFTKDLLSC